MQFCAVPNLLIFIWPTWRVYLYVYIWLYEIISKHKLLQFSKCFILKYRLTNNIKVILFTL